MKEIPLTQGKVAIVDDEDFELLSKHKWYYNIGYAVRTELCSEKQKTIKMHRAIMNIPSGLEIDHINSNGLDNRRTNLRACSHTENGKNQKRNVVNVSGYKGVSWHKGANKWQAKIVTNEKSKYLGLFDSPIDAAHAYDKAAIELHGVFARLNFEV